jgi:hypothetical protein
MYIKNFSTWYAITTLFLGAWVGCSQEMKDKETKADMTTKAKQQVEFQGVNYTIKDGPEVLG